MKTIKLTTLLSMLSLLMVACNIQVMIVDGHEDGHEDENPKTGIIEMKGYPDDNREIRFTAKVDKITIDWGDDSIDELTPNGVEKEFTHQYSNNNLQSIIINTEKLICISHNDFRNPYFKELRFEDCPNLEEIKFPNNQLTVLEVENARALKVLYCPNNQLIELIINECKALEHLNCRDNELTKLTIDRCVNLKELNCIKNKLTDLNVDELIELEALFCCCNKLTKLELDKNVNLKILECGGNLLSELNLQKCKLLQFIACVSNQLTVNKINELIENLPTYNGDYESIGNFEERFGSYEPIHGLYNHGYLLTGLYNTFNPINKVKGWMVI